MNCITENTVINHRICLSCGEPFVPKNYRQKKYCSVKCSNRAANLRKKERGYNWHRDKPANIEKICEQCKNTFKTKYGKTKYCSRNCVNLSQKGKGHPHTEESKKRLSEAQKRHLANNNQHRWSNSKRHKESLPETNFRKCLEELKIATFQYYHPPESERFFEFDFAIPTINLAFEINGQQHYQSDGQLAPYYKERHDYLSRLGWTIHELHYSECLYPDKTKSLIRRILENQQIEYQSSIETINHRVKRKQEKQELKQRERQSRLLVG